MSPLLGDALVGLAVFASAAYALAALGPNSWRARICSMLAAMALRLPGWLVPRVLTRRLASRLQAAAVRAGGCGGCAGCGAVRAADAKASRR